MTHASLIRLVLRQTMPLAAAAGLLLNAGCDPFDSDDPSPEDAGAASTNMKGRTKGDRAAQAGSGAVERKDAGASDPAAESDGVFDRGRRLEPDADSGEDTPEDTDAGRGSDGEHCGSAVDAPTIWLVVDGSGSMLSPFGDKTRWEVLKDALLDPEHGLVKRFERDVQWGLFLYDGSGSSGQGMLPDGGIVNFEPATTCSRIVRVSAGLDNYAAISSAFGPHPLGGSTPTHTALATLLSQLPTDPAALSRTSIVLATDGEPNDFCEAGTFSPPDVRPEVVAAVAEAAALGVKTYVVNLAAEDQALAEHLGQVAQAGATGRPTFAPSDQAALGEALADIVVAPQRCDDP
jgi:hypothetical protein